jgi:hypothetical protein
MNSRNKARKAGLDRIQIEQCLHSDHVADRVQDTVGDEPDADEPSNLEEPDELDPDDASWDVFQFDDESDPLPEYGDFWMPDD